MMTVDRTCRCSSVSNVSRHRDKPSIDRVIILFISVQSIRRKTGLIWRIQESKKNIVMVVKKSRYHSSVRLYVVVSMWVRRCLKGGRGSRAKHGKELQSRATLVGPHHSLSTKTDLSTERISYLLTPVSRYRVGEE
jgi:hypothetical protein